MGHQRRRGDNKRLGWVCTALSAAHGASSWPLKAVASSLFLCNGEQADCTCIRGLAHVCEGKQEKASGKSPLSLPMSSHKDLGCGERVPLTVLLPQGYILTQRERL